MPKISSVLQGGKQPFFSRRLNDIEIILYTYCRNPMSTDSFNVFCMLAMVCVVVTGYSVSLMPFPFLFFTARP